MNSMIHLECTACAKKFDSGTLQTLCTCGKVLYAQYDLELAKETLNKASMQTRKNNIWRMEEIMPCSIDFQYSLGEGGTPLLKLDTSFPFDVFVKEEGLNPTGSFKARGLCTAVSRAVELGVNEFVIPTAGNAGAALAAYCARTKTIANIFTPKDVPRMILAEMKAFGGYVTMVDGLITDAGAAAKVEAERHGWFDVSTLKEPYRVEGKKTMGLEIAEQLKWKLPDVIIYPTGGGTGIVGMVKAFDELETLGFIDSKRPRMVSVQSTGCAPIVTAFDRKEKSAKLWEGADTIAPGLRVPAAVGDYLILDAIYSSHGSAIAISDSIILDTMKEVAKAHGVFMSPESAATYAAMVKLCDSSWIDRGESVVIFNTGSGFTLPNLWSVA